MKSFSQNQKIALALLLLFFAGLKVGMLWWWQQGQKTAVAAPAEADIVCDVRQGCHLPNGAVLQMQGAISEKTPFQIHISQTPASVSSVHISFSMRDMDMGFNRYRLTAAGQGVWQAESIRLPVCVAQQKNYIAELHFDQTVYSVPFRAD